MTALSQEDSASLIDALRKVLEDRYEFAGRRRQELSTQVKELPAIWDRLVELGLTGLLVPEAYGGFNGGVADLQRVQRELGRSLVVAPWLSTALCTMLLARVASVAQLGVLLPSVADGLVSMTLADAEDGGLAGDARPTSAHRYGGGWQLHGSKTSVLHAGSVARYLVSAQLPEAGSAWFLVDASQPGITCRSYRLVDHSWAADLSFEGVDSEQLGANLSAQEQAALASQLRATEVAAYTAEALGAAEAALEMTVQYLRTRKQFGQALGDYQALRHRVAEMYIALEQARSANELATEATELGDVIAQARRSAQAQLISSEAVTWVLQQAIQLHGGMGMTEELAVGHYYRRILVVNALTGGAPSALDCLMQEA